MKIGILGGSFNPVHNGHLRVAVEALEQVGLDRVELLPASIPPHKTTEDMLPFAVRCRLLELSASLHTGLRVNPIEGEREGPSYTRDTLAIYRREHPGAELFFILGADDFQDLPSWYRWQELLTMTNFIVVGREEEGVEDLQAFLRTLAPAAPESSGQDLTWTLQGGTRVRSIAIPRLDISSTLLRSKLDQGKSMDFLVPEAVARELETYRNHRPGQNLLG
ncbi:MAG: nicotinate (nicotinamide) nucleotide adenylyltransferase [Desulfohalobiaceae bacterium]